jgi:hypothetical protein
MIPARFVVEYPKRCLELIEALEPTARHREFVGSFSLLVAAAVFVIPYERMRSQKHPLHSEVRDIDLFRALRSLRNKPFIAAPFWSGEPPNAWRFSRIMTNPNNTERWRDEVGLHPMATHATNSMERRKADDVLRVIRNALAHGNIVYLNEKGFEERNTTLQFLGFLSRYEETCEQKKQSETYRLVTTTEDEFLRFVKLWAKWVSQFQGDNELSEAA